MVNFVAKTKIRRDETKYFDYEDSVGFIFSILGELTDQIANGETSYENTVHCIFEQILNPFVDQFGAQIYEYENVPLYKELMVVLHTFIEFERLYLDVAKPVAKEVVIEKQECAIDDISDEEKARRARNKELKKLGPKQEDESCPIDMAYDVETDV